MYIFVFIFHTAIIFLNLFYKGIYGIWVFLISITYRLVVCFFIELRTTKKHPRTQSKNRILISEKKYFICHFFFKYLLRTQSRRL